MMVSARGGRILNRYRTPIAVDRNRRVQGHGIRRSQRALVCGQNDWIVSGWEFGEVWRATPGISRLVCERGAS